MGWAPSCSIPRCPLPFAGRPLRLSRVALPPCVCSQPLRSRSVAPQSSCATRPAALRWSSWRGAGTSRLPCSVWWATCRQAAFQCPRKVCSHRARRDELETHHLQARGRARRVHCHPEPLAMSECQVWGAKTWSLGSRALKAQICWGPAHVRWPTRPWPKSSRAPCRSVPFRQASTPSTAGPPPPHRRAPRLPLSWRARRPVAQPRQIPHLGSSPEGR